MANVQQRTWVRGKDGKWAKATQPSLSEILEALGMMTQPLSSPTDTMGAPVSWTLREHNRFVQGLKIYPDGPYERIVDRVRTKCYSDVKSYGFQCWQFVARQRADQAIKVEQLSSPNSSQDDISSKKRHRVRKWFRTTLKWCIETLSFRCLRRQEHDTVDRYPVQRRRSLLAPTEQKASYIFGEFIPVGGPAALRSKDTAERAGHRRNGSAGFATEPEDCHAYRRGVYPPSAYPTSQDEEDDNDDWIMRSARRAASEIDWYDSTPEPALLSSSIAKPVKNHGAWSTDEHERYCEGVTLFRYGSWKCIADHVGTRTVTQVMSHAQSVRAKRKRAEEREKRRPTGTKLSTSSAFKLASPIESTSTVTSRTKNARTTMKTPEELLLASMISPLPTSTNTPQIKSVAETTSEDSDATLLGTPNPNTCASTEVSNHVVDQPFVGELGAQNSVAENAEKARNDSESKSLRIQPTESLLLYPDAIVDSDGSLCSPPLDISLNDEDLIDLVGITSTQSQFLVASGG
ncbi:Myb domain [Phytophthora cactorum]|nr:Myb domain [Phytophthora cactorum]